jgi:hypothetical protein
MSGQVTRLTRPQPDQRAGQVRNRPERGAVPIFPFLSNEMFKKQLDRNV